MAAELIVQGTRGLGAIERAMIGSVAEAVIGRARCPVLTVPLEAHVPWDGKGAGPIVCATDFSAPALRATAHALSLARRSGAELVLVHVVDTPEDGNDPWAAEAERRLTHAAAATGLGTLARTAVLRGVPSEQILRVAGEREASVVVVGTRGARALGSIVFGSTARRVVRDAPCAVLTVRAG
jgi:nucleotide-binding universal stress UspA family protein